MWNLLVNKFQKGACRYLLHRYLGQYLKEKVTVDQLTVDLYDGTGSVSSVCLDCDALNALAEQHSLPIEFVEGTLEEISFSVPWSKIMQESCEIQIKGMRMTIQPKNRTDNGSSMIDSMFTSMASSMQLAEECLKNCDDIVDDDHDGTQEMSGLENCAKTIDAILSRVKISFTDTVCRIERCKKGSDVGIALEFHIKLWNYSDDSMNDAQGEPNVIFDSAFSHKKMGLEGLTCHCDLFSSKKYFMKHNTKSSQESDDEDEFEVPKNLIQIGKFSGRHEIKLQVKTDDSIVGPQVSLDCNFGSLIALLSPIQAHVLYTLLNDLLDPEEESRDGHSHRRSCSEKPMDVFDFKRVEEELQERLKPGPIGISGLGHQQGWSSACNDEPDDEFHPLKNRGMYVSTTSNLMNSSLMSNSSINSSMNQSMTDSLNVSTYKSAYNYATSHSSPPQHNAEKTKFSVSFASVSLVLLHEDILSLSSADAVFPETLKRMRNCSREFFESLYHFGAAVRGEKDIKEVREKLNQACKRSHHRVISAPLKVKGNVRSTTLYSMETSGTLAIGYCELIESLKDIKMPPSISTPRPECIEVLKFPRNFEHGSIQALKLEFKTKSKKGRTKTDSKISLKVTLSDCLAELDVSVVDRINALIKSPLHFYMNPKDGREQFETNYSLSSLKNLSLIKVNVKCPNLKLDFRFPIPDLRCLDDMNRIPCWIRNIRNDSIVIQGKELDFSTDVSSVSEVLQFDTKCHEFNIFYKHSPNDSPLLVATALADDPELDGMSLRSQGLDWPRVLVWISPKESPNVAADAEVQDSETFDTMNFMTMPTKKPSPFSGKRVVHENSEEEINNHGSESVIPGSRSEMNEFIEDTNKNVMYKIDLNFRFVEVCLESKHLFEEIYNRVGNDLLLWEPSCERQNSYHFSIDKQPSRSQAVPFSMCKSALKLDSDEEDEMAAFYSPDAGDFIRSPVKRPKIKCGQSEFTLYLSIGKGIGSFYTPLQDLCGNVIPGQKGQLTIKVQDANVFVVSGFKGETTLGYVSIVAQKAEMYHADFVRSGENLPRYYSDLVKTIFPVDEYMSSRISEAIPSDMLSVAIKINRDAAKGLKIFKVATGIREGTLNHRRYLPNRTWFTQLTDFFDVTDSPVVGYTPSVVLTELHLHLWNCSVDYMPINLPLRSVLTMETFSISSNIAAQTSTSVLRFMAEDAAFFISAKPTSNRLREDFVCVLDMDYFELSLRLCSNRNCAAPKIDLTATGHELHIRTCSDSFKSLLELLTYYNNEGDLYDPGQKDADSPFSPIQESSSEPALISTDEMLDLEERKLSESHSEHLHGLVAEAMIEPRTSAKNRGQERKASENTSPKFTVNQQLYDLHFAPDYNSAFQLNNDIETQFYPNQKSEAATSLPKAPSMESNGLPIDISPSDEDEEEFCILENDPGVGIIPKSGEPEARVLTNEPIRLIENHFAPPAGKMDALKAPKHYPNPVMRYSLKEMTIIWHLYGGDDFEMTNSRKSSGKSDDRVFSEGESCDNWKEQSQAESSEVDMAVDALNPGVLFSKTKAFESTWEAYESPKCERKQLPFGCSSWKQQGGKGRRHDTMVELHLSKIKLVHEIYPENAEQASRQVIVINNIEIFDKLRSSQFNKMLYLYATPSRPKQTHANMVMIKAAHIRPDPQLTIEECCLKISILPIRLNIDQDALLFIYQFFSELSLRSECEDDDSSGRLTNPPSHTPSVESLPIMTVNNTIESDPNSVNMEADDQGSNLLLFNDDPFGMDDTASTCSKDPSVDSSKTSSPVYFRLVMFSPEVPIRLDYRGKRVDMTHGPLAGLLMGLAQLNCSEIRLKQVHHRHGILGFDRLIAFLINEWAVDIKKNQLPSLLGGVGPIHSFVQLFQGMRDLFWLPIEQYQKDGRIAKGLQRGVNAFSTSTAMAALELTNKLIQTIQGAAEFTYDMVSPGPSVQQKRRQSSRRKKRYNQPGDIREGMSNAYNVVREGLGDTAHTIVRVASKEHEQKGISGAVGGVLRQIPPTVVRPIILVAEATSNVLDGFRSQLEPEFKKQSEEKWKET